MMVGTSLMAQTPQVTLDKNQIQLGDQVSLKISITLGAGQKLSKWFSYDTSGSHTEIISASKIDTAQNGASTSLQQTLVLTSFDSGKWALPIIAPVVTESNNRILPLKVDSLYLAVLPVDVSKLKDYHDIKGVELVSYFDMRYIWYGLLAILVIVIIALLVRYFIKKRKNSNGVSIADKDVNLKWALSQLSHLEQADIAPYEFALKQDSIVRTYLDVIGHVKSKLKTSEEIQAALQPMFSDVKMRQSFYQSLQFNDGVKFAKFIPTKERQLSEVQIVKEALKVLDTKWKEREDPKI